MKLDVHELAAELADQSADQVGEELPWAAKSGDTERIDELLGVIYYAASPSSTWSMIFMSRLRLLKTPLRQVMKMSLRIYTARSRTWARASIGSCRRWRTDMTRLLVSGTTHVAE